MLKVRLQQMSALVNHWSGMCHIGNQHAPTRVLHRCDRYHWSGPLASCTARARSQVVGKDSCQLSCNLALRLGAGQVHVCTPEHQLSSTRMYQELRNGQAYLENRFNIRPLGVVSKKLIGDRNIANAIRSCNLRDACTPAHQYELLPDRLACASTRQYNMQYIREVARGCGTSRLTSIEQKIHKINV